MHFLELHFNLMDKKIMIKNIYFKKSALKNRQSFNINYGNKMFSFQYLYIFIRV